MPALSTPIHIAMCDDHHVMRSGLSGLLEQLGDLKVVTQAGSCEELISKLAKVEVFPDVLIMDINMHGRNGWETLLEVRAQWPDARVLFLSFLKIDDVAANLLKYKANGFLSKDCNPDELVAAITRIHQDGSYLPRQVTRLMKDTQGIGRRKLSPNELRFLSFCADDLTYAEIADKMHVSPRTVDSYRSSLFEKLNVRTKGGLIVYAIRNGIISI